MSAFVQNEKNGLIYMTSPVIGAKHAFSTRFGGVSEGGLASLNLGFNRGDVRERVMENYRLPGRGPRASTSCARPTPNRCTARTCAL